MNDRILELIDAWMHDEATAEQIEELFDWVRAAPANASDFARVTSLHSDLRSHFSSERALQQINEVPLPDELAIRPATRTSQRRQWSISAAVAAGLLLLVAFVLLLVNIDTSSPIETVVDETDKPFVTVVQLDNAHWDRDVACRQGDRLKAETLKLESGRARLLFDDGMEVTLSGPATFELVSSGSANLTLGSLAATVAPGAEYFRVGTPSAEVFDLGTAFGVTVSDDGHSQVAVFDGAVRVFPMSEGTGQLLMAGQQIEVDVGKDLELAAFNLAPFTELLPMTAGIASVDGRLTYESQWNEAGSTQRGLLSVHPEGYSTILSRPLNVNASTAGEFHSSEEFDNSVLPVGSRLRSYVIDVSPQAVSRTNQTRGSVSFERPVAGLILNSDELNASDDRFSNTKSSAEAALNLVSDNGDRVVLSADGRTVSVEVGPGSNARRFRVVVDESYSEFGSVAAAMATVGASDSPAEASESASEAATAVGDGNVPNSADSPMGFRPPGKPGMRFLRSHDRNRDGMISKDELPGHLLRILHRFDANGDGNLTLDELPDVKPPMRPGHFGRPGDHRPSGPPP